MGCMDGGFGFFIGRLGLVVVVVVGWGERLLLRGLGAGLFLGGKVR